jgi:predicted Ser/Thr protein kinase
MVGRTVSHYQITQRLGAGGMGEIYKALDPRLNRTVAIKVLGAEHEASDDRRRRFLQEAQAASALNHPNIITIYDIVSEGPTQFMVMEFVTGKTLADLIPKGGLPLTQVLDYSVQIAAALEAAHAAGIIHRDLKPGNVMITDNGLVKVLDFGLAKLTSPAGNSVSLADETRTLGGAPLTVEGSIMGTVSYMSPEQAEGKPVDARSDIFAFGSMLYEMVTGERAFTGESLISTLSSILRDDVTLVAHIGGVPASLQNIVERCMRKNREERWQSIQAVRGALAVLKRDSDSGTLYQVAPLPPATKAKARKFPMAFAAAAVAIVAVAALAAWWMFGRLNQKPVIPIPQAAAPAVTAPTALPPNVSEDGILTNDGVLEMVKAHVPAAVIAEQIKSSKTKFNLTTQEVIRLNAANVPPEIIAIMRNPKGTAPVPAAALPPTPPPAPEPAPAAPSPLQNVVVKDGLPIEIRLTEDVPADVPADKLLHFTVMHELRVGNAVVLLEGAIVTGHIVDAAHKKLLGGKTVTYRLNDAETATGGKLALRALPIRHGEDSKRPLDKHTKELASPAGTQYIAYADGEQSVTARK